MFNQSEYESDIIQWYLSTGNTNVKDMPINLFLNYCISILFHEA